MPQTLKIDFVSDVSCPWCVIGLNALKQAVTNLGGQVKVDIHFQPFELNPQMPSEGQDIGEHIAQNMVPRRNKWRKAAKRSALAARS